MDYRIFDLGRGARLTYIGTDKFKKARLSVSLIGKADRERSPVVSLLMPLSFRGTEEYPGSRETAIRAEELYAAGIGCINNRCGGYHICGITASILNDEYVSEGDDESILENTFEFCSSLLLRPLFGERDVDICKKNQIYRIRSVKDNAMNYAAERFYKHLFRNEDSFTLTGEEDQVERITSDDLMREHKYITENWSLDIFYCGTADVARVTRLIEKYFGGVGRELEQIPAKITGYEGEPLSVTEEEAYREGIVLLGFRSGVKLTDPEYYAYEMLSFIYGDGENCASKLFKYVREKRSLCYYCGSYYIEYNGIMPVYAGISPDRVDEAKSEMLRQLEEIKKGKISRSEFAAARAMVEKECRAAEDHPEDYETFLRVSRLYGGPAGIKEYRDNMMKVTPEQVSEAAGRLMLDTIYFLDGTLAGEDDEDEE